MDSLKKELSELKRIVTSLKNQVETSNKRNGILKENIQVLIGEIKELRKELKK